MQPFHIVSPEQMRSHPQQFNNAGFIGREQPQAVSAFSSAQPMIAAQAVRAQPEYIQSPPSPFIQPQGQPVRVLNAGIPQQQPYQLPPQGAPSQIQLPPAGNGYLSGVVPQQPRGSSNNPNTPQIPSHPSQGLIQIQQNQLPPQLQQPSPSIPEQFPQQVQPFSQSFIPPNYLQSPQPPQSQQQSPPGGQFLLSANPSFLQDLNTIDNRSRFSNGLSTISQNVSIVSQQPQQFPNSNSNGHQRKVSTGQQQQQSSQNQQRLQSSPDRLNQHFIHNSQVVNPLSTYQQQLAVHQQQQQQFNQIQSGNPQFLSAQQQQQQQPQRQQQQPQQQQQQIGAQPSVQYPIYNASQDCEDRLHQLIEENQALITENEYYKQYLSSLPQTTQNAIVLGQQVHTLTQQIESLKVQLQIQTDDAAMWANREKELADRCKSLYDQLQKAKASSADYSTTCNQTQQPQQWTNSQPYFTQSSATSGQVYPAINVVPQPLPAEQLPKIPQKQPAQDSIPQGSHVIANPYLDVSSKQREDLVQSIIKQYKLGGGQQLPQEGQKNVGNESQAKPIEQSYSNEDFLKSHEEKISDWKTKYESLTQKLNGLNAQQKERTSNNNNSQNQVDYSQEKVV